MVHSNFLVLIQKFESFICLHVVCLGPDLSLFYVCMFLCLVSVCVFDVAIFSISCHHIEPEIWSVVLDFNLMT